MRNTAVLLVIIGIFLVINAGNFTDVIMGKAHLSFVNPKTQGG